MPATRPGEPPAEAQRRGGVFDLVMGVGGVQALIQTFFKGGVGVIRCPQTKSVAENSSNVSLNSLPSPSAPLRLCASPPHPESLPQRAR